MESHFKARLHTRVTFENQNELDIEDGEAMRSCHSLLNIVIVALVLTSMASPCLAQRVDAKTIVIERVRPEATEAFKVLDMASKSVRTMAVTGLSEALIKLPTDEAEASVGRGYDVWNGAVTIPTCVEARDGMAVPFEPKVNSGGAARRVRSEVAHSEAGGDSFSLGFMIKSMGLGFAHSSASGDYFNNVDEFARVTRFVELKGQELQRVKWTKYASDLLNNNRVADFVKFCGTRYVRIVRSGQRLDSTVRMALNSTGKATGDATALSLSVGKVFNLGAGGSSAETSLSTTADISYIDDNKGVIGRPTQFPNIPQASQAGSPTPAPTPAPTPGAATGAPPTSGATASSAVTVPNGPLVSLLTFTTDTASGFDAAAIKAGTDQAVPLWIALERYVDQDKDDLPMLDRIPTWVDDIEQIVLDKFKLFQELSSAKSDTDYALDNGPVNRLDVFYNLSDIVGPPSQSKRQQAEALQSAAIALMTAFQSDVKTCRDKVDEALKTDPISGHNVAVLCQTLLNTHLTEAAVNSVKLQRKYVGGP